ncbi:MAG: hypothetical protein LAT55_06000 [Opitutales bacterium]|nr:hypothetical protein [Opitutales bacterium]
MDNQNSQSQETLSRAKILLREFSEAVVGKGERSLTEILAELDRLAVENRRELPGDLRHYLERRSYQKAAAFLGVE